jgi:Tfp pilus assembly protein FimT
MIVVAISAMIMGVVMFNYRAFVDQLAINSAAQDLALSLREAQTYGLSVKEVTTTDSSGNPLKSFDFAYGVYVSPDEGQNKGYDIFVDKILDNKYSAYKNTCNVYEIGNECISRKSFGNNIVVSAIGNDTSLPISINPTPTAMHIMFKRPVTDALVRYSRNMNLICCPANSSCGTFSQGSCPSPQIIYNAVYGRIQLRSPLGLIKTIYIYNSGQIEIK